MSILVLKPTGDLEIEPPTQSFPDGFYFPITLFILGYIKLSPILCCFKITMSSAHPWFQNKDSQPWSIWNALKINLDLRLASEYPNVWQKMRVLNYPSTIFNWSAHIFILKPPFLVNRFWWFCHVLSMFGQCFDGSISQQPKTSTIIYTTKVCPCYCLYSNKIPSYPHGFIMSTSDWERFSYRLSLFRGYPLILPGKLT